MRLKLLTLTLLHKMPCKTILTPKDSEYYAASEVSLLSLSHFHFHNFYVRNSLLDPIDKIDDDIIRSNQIVH